MASDLQSIQGLIPCHHRGAVPSQSSHLHTGMEWNLLNQGYFVQQDCINHNMNLHPNCCLFQQRSDINHQRQHNIAHQPTPNVTAGRIFGLQASQHKAKALQQMTNQRIGLQNNQLSSIGHRHSSQNVNPVGHHYTQPPAGRIFGLQPSQHNAKALQQMTNQRIVLPPNQLSSIGHRCSSQNLNAVHGLQTLQHSTEVAQQMFNQRNGVKPCKINSVNGFQESLPKSNYYPSCAKVFKGPSRTTELPQPQFNQNMAIQESQGLTKQAVSFGTKDSPIKVFEDNAELLDSVYQRIQKCKEECLQDVLKVYRQYASRMPQKMPRDFSKKIFIMEEMIKLLNMQRSSMEHKVDQKVHKKIDEIYAFSRHMRTRYPKMFSKPGEESKSAHGEEQTMPSAICDQNHTQQKPDLLQQESAADSDSDVIHPLQPAKKSTDTHLIEVSVEVNQCKNHGGEQITPSSVSEQNHAHQKQDLLQQESAVIAITRTDTHLINASIDVNQRKNLDQEDVIESSPIDRLVKAVTNASHEALKSVAQDIFAVTRDSDRTYEILPNQRMKRSFNVMAMQKPYDIDGLTDSGSQMLNSDQSSIEKAKRQRVEENKSLMTEIEFLNGKLLETRVTIVKPDDGLPTLEVGSDITLSCTFIAASLKAMNELSHLFPVLMQLRIPRDYPLSGPSILPCRHQNCGAMCAMLQTKYECISRCCEMKSVKEIVQEWNDCAGELYADICLGPGRRSLGHKFDTWEEVTV